MGRSLTACLKSVRERDRQHRMTKIERGKEKRRNTEKGKNYEKVKRGCISRMVSDKQRQQRPKETQIIYYESMNNNYSISTSFDASEK
jgi:hypothetical protein